jgi:hypothetical protein
MKTLHVVPVNYLRIYPVPKERISKVNKVKSLKYGSLVLMENLPRSVGQAENNVVEFTDKQLDNLCSIARIRGTGANSWYLLSEAIGTMESVASITALSHVAGEKYINGDGTEVAYLEDSTSCSVDSIVLPESVRTQIRAKAIEKIVNWTDQNDIVKKMLAGNESTPILEGVK